MPGCLVLTAQESFQAETEIMQMLRKICKFSARRQKQVTEVIVIC